MSYTPKPKEWFIERINKRIFRDDQGCSCNTCKEVSKEGLIVSDVFHAECLAEVDHDFGLEGIFSNYRDVQ